ncbi:hypothetical protein A2634_04525 [Candidatus Amesbacteria bacterium RIFCSPHIGHO2_01_FULL_48_32]|uniref:Prepilin-type N-terminal cleavage/methylation domain-containing protein n=1 Tax=Candidatus Amesbacteria bacterium RIFCSPLOWO2_01_FULL_48_25 TaxID=1797259 RepID=A0A1F4ZCY5_9BACT|nr:MAG: hypothetical protein A2634_04525 [Candidatus Amesbacteria bacterium RIFCSPHIGHO2_01_FULL_48_32]OGD03806.1 MAG: hypothetical protein A2989_03995 [Candidatus Amesbacteria bacterium RIFCSPLOWO2_01_FULL_48_25]HJZ05085.1 type II secretion system protein [Patescibacteria group bacterium]
MTRRGFTLVELVVVIGLSGLIFVVVSGLTVSLLTVGTKNRHQQTLEQARDDVTSDISNIVKWREGILAWDNNRLQVGDVVYEKSGDRFLKNGVSLLGENVVVTEMGIENYSALEDYPSLIVGLKIESRVLPQVKDEIKLVVSRRKTTIETDL